MPIVRNIETYDIRAKHEVPFVRIMRGSPWTNPFVIGRDGDDKEVRELFKLYARWRMKIQPTWVDKLIGKDLLCAMEDCHGEVLIKIVKERELELLRKKKL